MVCRLHFSLRPSPTSPPMWLPHSFIALLLAVLVDGSFTNTTIDDSDSSFTFDGAWNTITPTSPCDICSSKPDPSQTNDGTWHDGNIRNGAPSGTTGSFTFKGSSTFPLCQSGYSLAAGSAVYIFGIDQAQSQPNIAFTLGSVQTVHHYAGTEQFVYNALFFSATGLAADQTHTVNWEFDIANTSVPVQAALFDYAIVSSGEEDTIVSPTLSPTVGATALYVLWLLVDLEIEFMQTNKSFINLVSFNGFPCLPISTPCCVKQRQNCVSIPSKPWIKY